MLKATVKAMCSKGRPGSSVGQGSAADQRLVAEVRARLVRDEDGIGLPAEAARVGVVEWR